ncbi:MAG: ABC transporter permease subunit [Gemmatimonadetes bacterium]|nr:ABC transporter permease subunit [Gemmatimonadota bacterium]
MGTASVVFRRELAEYVRSALGYVVVAAVLLLAGLLFYAQALGPAAGERLSGEVLAQFFYTMSGLVAIAAVVLSIRLIAEERQAGTLVLLNTSPVRDWEVVLGKFLSALAFLGAITMASFYLPLLVIVNGKVSLGQVFVGYLGLLLIGSACLAIGLFATSLTRHQLVAAVVGSALTGTMFLFWQLSLVLDPPLSRVFAGLAIHARHFQGFQVGILHVRDVVYYLAVTYFFLLLAIKTMEVKRWE